MTSSSTIMTPSVTISEQTMLSGRSRARTRALRCSRMAYSVRFSKMRSGTFSTKAMARPAVTFEKTPQTHPAKPNTAPMFSTAARSTTVKTIMNSMVRTFFEFMFNAGPPSG